MRIQVQKSQKEKQRLTYKSFTGLPNLDMKIMQDIVCWQLAARNMCKHVLILSVSLSFLYLSTKQDKLSVDEANKNKYMLPQRPWEGHETATLQ